MQLPVNLGNVEPATGFDYPPGQYLFRVDSCEIRTNQDGVGQRLLVGNVIEMGPGPSTQFQGRKLSNSYQLTEKGAPFLMRFFLSCGITKEMIQMNGGMPDSDWLIGRQFMAQVVKNQQYTNITNEKPVSEWNPTNGAGGTQAAAGPAPQPALLQPTQTAMPPAQPVQPTMAVQPQMAAQQPQMPQQPQMAAQQPTMMAQLPQPAGPQQPAGMPAPPPPPGTVGQS